MTSKFNKLAQELLTVLIRHHHWELVALQEENRRLLARLSQALPPEQLEEFLRQSSNRRDSLGSVTSALSEEPVSPKAVGSDPVSPYEPSKPALETTCASPMPGQCAAAMPVLTVTAPSEGSVEKQVAGSEEFSRFGTPMPTPNISVTAVQTIQVKPAAGSQDSEEDQSEFTSRYGTPMPPAFNFQSVPVICVQDAQGTQPASTGVRESLFMRIGTPLPPVQVSAAEGSSAGVSQDCGMRIATPMPPGTPVICVQDAPGVQPASAETSEQLFMRISTPMPSIQVSPVEGSSASSAQDCGLRIATPMPPGTPIICVQDASGTQQASAPVNEQLFMRIATPMPSAGNDEDCTVRIAAPMQADALGTQPASAVGEQLFMRIATPMPSIQISPVEGSTTSSSQDCGMRIATPMPAIQVVPVQGAPAGGTQDVAMQIAMPLPPSTPLPGTPMVRSPRPSLPCTVGTPLPGICVVGADGVTVEPLTVSAQDLRISTPMPNSMPGLPASSAPRSGPPPMPIVSLPADGQVAVALLENGPRRTSTDSCESAQTIDAGHRESSMVSIKTLNSDDSSLSNVGSVVSKSTIPVPKTAADLYGGGPKRYAKTPIPGQGRSHPQSTQSKSSQDAPRVIGTSSVAANAALRAMGIRSPSESERKVQQHCQSPPTTSEAASTSLQSEAPPREGSMDFASMESIRSMDLVPDSKRHDVQKTTLRATVEELAVSNGLAEWQNVAEEQAACAAKPDTLSTITGAFYNMTRRSTITGLGDGKRVQSLILPDSEEAVAQDEVRRVSAATVQAAATSGWCDASVNHAIANHLELDDRVGSAPFVVHPFWAFNTADCLVSRKTFVELVNGGRQMDRGNTQVFREILVTPAEEEEELYLPKWCQRRVPLHPDGSCRVIWEMFCLILISYDFIMLPLHFFEEPAFKTGFFYGFSWVGRISWTLDLMMSFLTGQYHHGVVEMRTSQVAKRYMKSWFIFDVALVVISWATIEKDGENSSQATSTSGLRTLRLVRFLRLLRLLKVEMMLRDILERFNSNYLILCNTLVKCIVGLAVINHIIACIWYHVGSMGNNGWVSRLSEANGYDLESFSYQYFTSVHWSLAQFTGSIDISPVSLEERFFAVIVLLLAIIVFSSFISTLSNTMLELQSLQSEKYTQQRVLRRFLHENLISPTLSLRVKKYLRGANVQERIDDAVAKALETLPEELQKDLLHEIRSPLLHGHMFLADLSASFPRLVRQLCHEAMEDHAFLGGDCVFTCGDACSRIYFVQRGSVKYIAKKAAQSFNGSTDRFSKDCDVVQSLDTVGEGGRMLTKPAEDNPILTRGMWLSEAAMWTRWEHCGDLIAVQPTSMFTMDNSIFAEKVSQHCNAYTATKRYALCFVDLMNSGVNCTDLMELEMPDSQRESFRKSLSAQGEEGGRQSEDEQRHGVQFSIFLQTVSTNVTSRVSQTVSSARSSQMIERNVRFSVMGGGEPRRTSAMHGVFAKKTHQSSN